MTYIELRTYKDAYEISAEGHATGSVEVCAAISTLMTALANWVFQRSCHEDQVLEPGHACVVIPKAIAGAKTIFEFAQMTFEMICEDAENFCELGQKFGQEGKMRLI